MDLIDKLELTVRYLTAIVAIGGFIVGFLKVLKRLSQIGKTLETLVEHDSEQYLSILRLTVMSEEMPIAERVIAGRKYISAGGNGAVKKYYEEYLAHLHEDKEE